ncbi:MAG TPA: efflux RND transporter periplasmic adaptor subunit [Ignavibacteriaceae bacterium]|nr:efflux RND transporter periplasmic adaptor subunit [Ignavibacteriaceae bacterium]
MKIFLVLSCMAFLIALTSCSGNGDGNSIEASGTIEATNITVSAKTAGEIKYIKFEEGERINAGDTILLIDRENLLIQLKQAEAASLAAENQFQLLKNGARKEDIKQTENTLKQAEISFQQAAVDKERFENLYKSKSITKKQYEDAALRYELANAQLSSAKESFNKIKSFARPEEIKQAEARYMQSKASEELIRKNLRDSYVTSPIPGFIVKKFVEKGEMVTPMSSLFKVSNLSMVELIIYVSGEELGKVKLGQAADVSVDAFKNKSFKGKVIYISPEAEFTPKNIQTKDERTKLVFAVKIKIENPQFELKAGMPADAVIKIN